jgi:tripartite-type tricarboxylate transporter receptor subunit TctC
MWHSDDEDSSRASAGGQQPKNAFRGGHMQQLFRFASVVKAGLLGLGLTLGVATQAVAQAWPTLKPITIIVPYAAGGGADFVIRLIADDLTKRLNQTIIIENRGGANGTIGAAAVARAAPDGYTYMLIPSGPMVNAKLLSEGLPYNPDTDFTAVMKVVFSPIVIVTSKDVPAKNLKELVAYAKANPGALNVGNSGPNSTQELTTLMFAGGTGIEVTRVPYKGSGQVVPDLLANRLQMMIDFPSTYMSHEKAGAVRILATFNPTRIEAYPDLPTIAESGFPEVPAWQGWFGLFGPKGLPEDIRAKFAAAVTAYLTTPEAKAKLANGGYIPTPEGPESVNAFLKSETEALTKVIAKFGLKKQPL